MRGKTCEFSKRITRSVALRYLLYDPRRRGSRARIPLVLFLHGAGERGTNLDKVKVHGLPKLLEHGHRFPFIVVAPQCPEGEFWPVEPLAALLDDLVPGLHADPARIYVTGLSMGGYGTWSLANIRANRLAAIVPICGPFAWVDAHRFRKLPVWCFHGAQDSVVPLSDSMRMAQCIRQVGGRARLTVYPDAGHDSWTETYSNPDLYRWLLSQRRK